MLKDSSLYKFLVLILFKLEKEVNENQNLQKKNTKEKKQLIYELYHINHVSIQKERFFIIKSFSNKSLFKSAYSCLILTKINIKNANFFCINFSTK